MRLSSPRIPPLADADLSPEQAEALAPFLPDADLNIFRTLAQAPKALTRFNGWGGYILSRRNALPPRERELAILRVAYLCRSGYEWTQHCGIALEAGVTTAEIARLKQRPRAGWNVADAAILRAADELVGEHFVSDQCWADLEAHFDQKQRMDLVFTIAQYTQVAMMLNTFGVQLEPGLALDPDFDFA